MNKKLLLTVAFGAMATNTTWAGTYEWTSGYAQGVAEHMVDDGNGNELNISCPDDNESSVTAYATIAGKQYASNDVFAPTFGTGFDVIVDGTRYSNPFFTNCDACASSFPAFWKALRNANNLQISASGKTVKLPTKSIKKVLLPLDNKENSCRSTW